jgi:hypothetical protein
MLSLVEVYHRLGSSNGGSTDFWNVGKLIPVHTAQYLRRQPSLYSRPWEPEIPPIVGTFSQIIVIDFSKFYRNMIIQLHINLMLKWQFR